MKSLFVFPFLLVACGGSPIIEEHEIQRDAGAMDAPSDPCTPPSYTEPGCVRIIDHYACFGSDAPTCPHRTVCPQGDGTEWDLTDAGGMRSKYVVEPQTNHAIAKYLCSVTPAGLVVERYAR